MPFGFFKSEDPREAIFKATKATKATYDKHYALAKRQKVEPIQMGLFGALGSRFKLRRMFKSDFVHMVEIVPFVMMGEEDRVAALAFYLLWFEMPHEVDHDALKLWINEALRNRGSPLSDEAYQLLVQSMPLLRGSGIAWLAWLDEVNANRLSQDIRDAMKEQ